ncbi:MAG: prolyl oligopeptidase family serine peptidase [Siphonobacter sp.]
MKTLYILCFLCVSALVQAQNQFREEEVSYWNKADSIPLNGTLTIPNQGKNFPAVILISGSGPQDRDETLFGHKPFKIIAEYLSNRGYAVLRYDDRGGGKANKIYTDATIDNFAKDAEAGLDYLKTRPEINSRKIGFLGHSEGGSIAPMIASKRKDVAFVILMAAPGRRHDVMMAEQNRDLFRAMGVDSNLVNLYVEDYYNKVFPQFPNLTDTAQVTRLVHERIAYLRTKMTKEQLFSFGIPPQENVYMKAIISTYNNKWLRHFISFNPEIYLEQLKVPTLAINGTKDTQVNANLNLAGIETGLKKAKNKNYKIVRLEELNHLMQHAKTGLPTEYPKIQEDLAPEFIDTVYEWLKKTIH